MKGDVTSYPRSKTNMKQLSVSNMKPRGALIQNSTGKVEDIPVYFPNSERIAAAKKLNCLPFSDPQPIFHGPVLIDAPLYIPSEIKLYIL